MPGDRVFVVTKPEAQITPASPVVPVESEPSSSKSSEASYSIIQPLDMLRIDAIGTLTDQPIDDSYLVYPDGQVALGPAYGRVKVDGLTWEEAERKITQHLKKTLAKPEVQVALARRGPSPETALLPSFPYTIRVWDVLSVIAIGTLKDQPIDGFYLVEPGGKVALGPAYGRADVNGLTCEQAEKKIVETSEEGSDESRSPSYAGGKVRRTVARSRTAEDALQDRRLRRAASARHRNSHRSTHRWLLPGRIDRNLGSGTSLWARQGAGHDSRRGRSRDRGQS